MTGQQEGDYYSLGKRTNVIGRDEALPIQILDERISRKHLKIHYHPDKDTYYAVDMNSKHGVFVNGEKINEQTELSNDAIITIGSTSLMFTLKDFANREDASLHYKKVGEKFRGTVQD
ncbi:MAG: FHA domain-containing protein [Planctomycetes bacterium]|nr:FHA domain-containing protein [Planctomycetota bacterium]